MDLALVRSIEVPVTIPFRGARLGPRGRVLIWSPDGRELTEIHAGRFTRLCSVEGDSILVADYIRSQEIEAVTRRGLILRVDRPTNTCVRRGSVVGQSGLQPLAAAYAGRWVVAAVGDSGAYLTWSATESGLRESTSAVQLRPRTTFLHSGGDDVVIAASMLWPFRTQLLSSSVAFQPFLGDTVFRYAADTVAAVRLTGMGVHSVDRGYLMVLSDLRSDLRVLVLFDSTGLRQRVTLLNVPLGFMDSDTETQTLLGVRTASKVELLFYRWSWR